MAGISCHWRYCLPSDQAKHFGGGHLQRRTADLAWCLEKCEDGCAGHVLEHLPIISTLQSGFSAVYIDIIYIYMYNIYIYNMCYIYNKYIYIHTYIYNRLLLNHVESDL